MDFNKEEALRAKHLAEKKMEAGDFIMAKKFGERAAKIAPDLENISQLMIVCEVHISAQKKINGSEMDWYGILQVERTADEATIKKQFRKLALQLHPDKNKFAGAEAAFKLIGEANRLLTDQTKRSQYDMKCRVSIRPVAPKPPSYQSHNNSFTGATNSSSNVPSQFSGSYSRQWAPHMTFWTTCQFCHVRYQYFREYVNRVLRCQNCGKSFTAFDFGPQPVPPGSSQFPGQKQVPYQGSFAVPTASKTEVDKGSTTKEKGGANTMEGEKNGVVGGEKKGVEVPKPEVAKPRPSAAEPCDLGTSRTTNRKRKLDENSSESFETSDSDDSEVDETLQDNVSNFSGANSGCDGECQPRRSSRHKQKISYNENSSDDDFVNRVPKRPKGSGLSGINEEKMKDVNAGISENDKSVPAAASMDACNGKVEQKPGNPFAEHVPKKSESVEHQAKENAVTSGHDEKKSQTDDNSELNSSDSDNPAGGEYPEPEFSDFDKDKGDGCFTVNQIWAIYDDLDAMPRFYARVKRVFPPQNGFKLEITWLESHSINEDERNWSAVLPVACSRYKLGTSDIVKSRLIFSHQMDCIEVSGKRRGPFFIYPKVGETWALFRDWNINWSADPDQHQPPYQYEFVEVIKDFSEDDGIGVAYLHKVKGFISLFQRAKKGDLLEVQIPPGELYRFSHRIPSFRMTGKEREGVPIGSFELDPVSLPNDLDNLGDTGDVKMEGRGLDAEADGLCSKSQASEGKPLTGSQGIHMSKTYEKSSLDRESFVLRRSPRKSNGMHPNQNESYASKSLNYGDASNEVRDSDHTQSKGCSTSCQVDKKCNIPKEQEADNLAVDALRLRRSQRDLSRRCGQVNASQSVIGDADLSNTSKHGLPDIPAQSKGNTSPSQDDDTVHLRLAKKASNGVRESLSISASVCSGGQTTGGKSLDFKREKFEDKFQIDQIWALYDTKDRMPKDYAQVKKIENTPDFSLHVARLEACTPAKDATHPVCCGVFKVQYGQNKVVSRSSFSHQLQAERLGRGKYEIYPRKGEVWALYKNWNSGSDCSDLGECEIVEVLDDNKKSTKVMVLTCINASKSLYKAPRSQRLKTSIIEVSRNESGRFSHQIPAFQHTGDKDHLRGYWELDPAAVPGIIVLD